MTAARLLQSITSWGVHLAVRDDRLVVQGRPSRNVQLLIGLYREALLAALQGHDQPLSTTHPREQLVALGFVEWPSGWVHTEGDDVGYQILCGDISFESATAAQADRTHQAQSLAHVAGLRPRTLPPVEEPELRPGTHLGHSVVTIHKGRRYRLTPREE